MCGNSQSSTKMLMEKKKRILLEDEVSDWFNIWTAASSLDVKGNKAIKKNFFLAIQSVVVPNMITHITLCCQREFCLDNYFAKKMVIVRLLLSSKMTSCMCKLHVHNSFSSDISTCQLLPYMNGVGPG